jgi:hypothetical protein
LRLRAPRARGNVLSRWDAIPFAVELRPAGGPVRVLGRGVTLTLALAIYEAALAAYPGARVVLIRGVEMMRDSQVTT